MLSKPSNPMTVTLFTLHCFVKPLTQPQTSKSPPEMDNNAASIKLISLVAPPPVDPLTGQEIEEKIKSDIWPANWSAGGR